MNGEIATEVIERGDAATLRPIRSNSDGGDSFWNILLREFCSPLLP